MSRSRGVFRICINAKQEVQVIPLVAAQSMAKKQSRLGFRAQRGPIQSELAA